MIKYLFKNSDASSDLTSYKAPGIIRSKGTTLFINSVEFIWSVSGTADAEFEIAFSNDRSTDSIVKTITMNNADNKNNTQIVMLYPAAEYVSVNYRSNSVTSGTLSVCLNYSALPSAADSNYSTIQDIFT